jgi:streptomycin 6-kinase
MLFAKMNDFKANFTHIYGCAGELWLKNLDNYISSVASRFGLTDLSPVADLSYHYVARGYRSGDPVILKLGLDFEELNREACALKVLKEYGAVELLEEDAGILLLKQIIPGTSLKGCFNFFNFDDVYAACSIINITSQAIIPKSHHFSHVKDVLGCFERFQEVLSGHHELLSYVKKAIGIKKILLQESVRDVFLHGDLHHDNILWNDSEWRIIDPKGFIGDLAYEVAAFIRNPIAILRDADPKICAQLIIDRIEIFSYRLGIPVLQIKRWCFVHSVLAWIWDLEDGLDDRYSAMMVRLLDHLLPR